MLWWKENKWGVCAICGNKSVCLLWLQSGYVADPQQKIQQRHTLEARRIVSWAEKKLRQRRQPFGQAKNSRRPQQEQIERELLCGTICRDNSRVEARGRRRAERPPAAGRPRLTTPHHRPWGSHPWGRYIAGSSRAWPTASQRARYCTRS